MPRALTPEEFLGRSLNIWGDRWNYELLNFKGMDEAVTLICKDHGEFSQVASKHIYSKQVGCKRCHGRSPLTHEEFLSRAKGAWGERWDYTDTLYVNSVTPVEIGCSEHGKFLQVPSSHWSGKVGCPRCRGEVSDLDSFIFRASQVWGGRWSYSKTVYRGHDHPILIGCAEHGDFEQLTGSHLSGFIGCSMCANPFQDRTRFMAEAGRVWKGRWDLSRVDLVSSAYPIEVICKTHGEFNQRPFEFIQGKVGCIPCQNTQTSKGEQEVLDLFQSLEEVDPQHRVKGLLSNPRIELDIYAPEKKVAIEFNGVYWHSSKFKDKDAHHTKFKLAVEAGIKLVQVWEDDWNLRRPIVEEHLKQVLGVSTLPKIAARKTKVVEVPYSVAKDFLNANHIQGAAGAAFHLSLQYEEDVVALASFKRRSDGDLELVRYATSANVQGGHSKLVTYVERNYTYNQLVTFADLTFGSGELYRKTGWVEDKFLSPDYQYLVGGQRIHKFNYRLKRFREDPDLQYVAGMSESQLAELNGLLRVYDAGKIRFVKKHPNDDTI